MAELYGNAFVEHKVVENSTRPGGDRVIVSTHTFGDMDVWIVIYVYAEDGRAQVYDVTSERFARDMFASFLAD